jgi:hypothetical protein
VHARVRESQAAAGVVPVHGVPPRSSFLRFACSYCSCTPSRLVVRFAL